jgi:hypothetical protein
MSEEPENADDPNENLNPEEVRARLDAQWNRLSSLIRVNNPKIPVRAKIPAQFARFMQEVAARIKAGDESTTIESDDLLQAPCCYGGLTSAETGQFFFCFYPGGEDDETKWQFDLTRAQIEAIAAGSLTELNLWKCGLCSSADRFGGIDGYCRPCDAPK